MDFRSTFDRKINGRYLNNLHFAEDIAIIASSHEELYIMLAELSTDSEKIGLSFNHNKTSIMTNDDTPSVLKIGEIATIRGRSYLSRTNTFL